MEMCHTIQAAAPHLCLISHIGWIFTECVFSSLLQFVSWHRLSSPRVWAPLNCLSACQAFGQVPKVAARRFQSSPRAIACIWCSTSGASQSTVRSQAKLCNQNRPSCFLRRPFPGLVNKSACYCSYCKLSVWDVENKNLLHYPTGEAFQMVCALFSSFIVLQFIKSCISL